MPALTSVRARSRSIGLVTAVAVLMVLGGCGGGGASSSDVGSAATATGTGPQLQGLPGYATFIYPSQGQLSVDGSQAFKWTGVSNAAYYQLQVGSAPGGSDIFDSGIITTTSITVPKLPTSGVVYARVRAILQGWSTELPAADFPQATHAAFSMDAAPTGAVFTSPAPGATLDADTPISWQADPLAVNYRLQLFRASDGVALLDTGTIHGTHRVVANLPAAQAVIAKLTTDYAQSLSRTQSVTFTAGKTTTTVAGMLTLARNVTATVRLESDIDDQPFGGTPLQAQALSLDDGAADCVDYSRTLMTEFADAALPLKTRIRDICFNAPDCHELVEVYNSDLARWETLDPTFGLYTLNSSGQPATAEEISAAVRNQAINSLSFTFVTAQGSKFANLYYLDYPLLFMDLYTIGSTSSFEEPPPLTLQPYEDLKGTSTTGPIYTYYAIQCAAGVSSASANWDGNVVSHPCTNGYTEVFAGKTVSLVAGDPSALAIWAPHRFVF